jgi:hypothetical protein
LGRETLAAILRLREQAFDKATYGDHPNLSV